MQVVVQVGTEQLDGIKQLHEEEGVGREMDREGEHTCCSVTHTITIRLMWFLFFVVVVFFNELDRVKL